MCEPGGGAHVDEVKLHFCEVGTVYGLQVLPEQRQELDFHEEQLPLSASALEHLVSEVAEGAAVGVQFFVADFELLLEEDVSAVVWHRDHALGDVQEVSVCQDIGWWFSRLRHLLLRLCVLYIIQVSGGGVKCMRKYI